MNIAALAIPRTLWARRGDNAAHLDTRLAPGKIGVTGGEEVGGNALGFSWGRSPHYDNWIST